MKSKCLILTILLTSTIWFYGCGSRKVHIEEYKSGAVVEKVSETKSESKTTNETEKLTNIVNQSETKDLNIKIDEVVIEDKYGNTTTLKGVEITDKKTSDNTNINESEKTSETTQNKAETQSNEVSKTEQSEKVRDTDRKQFNFTLLIVQIFVALVVLAGAYWLYKRVKKAIL